MTEQSTTIDGLKAVILVGGKDFGRCPLASRLNRVMWPVMGRPALQRLIEALAEQGVRRFVISCENQAEQIRRLVSWNEYDLDVVFHEESLPRGPAGCVRDARDADDQLLLVLPGAIVNPPDVNHLLVQHRQQSALLTMFLNPTSETADLLQEDSQIYLCEPQVLNSVPEAGYFDLKEGLIPAMVGQGVTIASARLPEESGHFLNWPEYLQRLRKRCRRAVDEPEVVKDFKPLETSPAVWVGANVAIADSARFYGPVVIGDDSVVAPGAMIFGPTVIARGVTIGYEAIVEESVLWDYAVVGDKGRARHTLVDTGQSVAAQMTVSKALAVMPKSKLKKTAARLQSRRLRDAIQKRIRKGHQKADVLTLETICQANGGGLIGPLVVFLVLGAIIFSYWMPTVKNLATEWLESDEYSSGLLVPLIAGYVLWSRRKELARLPVQPCRWAFGLFALAVGLRFVSLYLSTDSGERISFVLAIGAAVMCLLGWRFFWKIAPIFLFLFLMLPLPQRVENAVAVPLQGWATVSSVFCLETLGFSVIQEGNIIDINGTQVAVAEACNGLRMLTAFIVVSGLVALVTSRRWPGKAMVLLSSIPIALVCNTIRLTVTAIAFTKLDTERWEKAFHDFGGFAMMPLALLLVMGELWLLSRAVIEPKRISKQKQVIYRRKSKINPA